LSTLQSHFDLSDLKTLMQYHKRPDDTPIKTKAKDL
jgi:hypothetical protein